jgi:hypothetical protein
MIGRDCVSASGFENVIAAGWPDNAEQRKACKQQQPQRLEVSRVVLPQIPLYDHRSLDLAAIRHIVRSSVHYCD